MKILVHIDTLHFISYTYFQMNRKEIVNNGLKEIFNFHYCLISSVNTNHNERIH